MNVHSLRRSHHRRAAWRAATVGARRLSAALLAASLLPAAAGAQVWNRLDSSPAGTPAEVVFDSGSSTQADSFFDVFVHGYWSESVAPGDGNTYQRITVPGLGRIGQEGAPDLPVARLRLAVTNTATSVQLMSVTDLDPHVVPASLPLPFGVQQTDEAFDPTLDPGPGDLDGSPEQFVIDPAVYGGTAVFPASPATGSAPVQPWMDSLPSARVEISPFGWDPGTGLLSASGHLRVHFQAAGVTAAFPSMTPDRAGLAAATFDNWSAHSFALPVDGSGFGGNYLIVTSQVYLPTLEPFINLKQGQGFDVDILELESIAFLTCGNIRAAIDAWYQSGSPWDDHYCLLVGDIDALPMCSSPSAPQYVSDDLYGSPGDGDLDEEIFVGRLSVDDADDLSRQLDKIIEYHLNQTAQHFDEALLVANLEDAPGKYEGNHESVANASYAVPPSFEKLYGSVPGNDNADVRSAIHQGTGLVAYRGHGSSTSWWQWNTLNELFHKNEILVIPDVADSVVMWSFSCWNNRLDYGTGLVDGIGESWMERPGTGAVAHYGSTHVSGTAQNHVLNQSMFKAVYDLGLTRHGQAIAWAEARMAELEPGKNSWMYMLLGDPSMHIRRVNPTPLTLLAPQTIPTCPPGGGPCSFDVRVSDDQGSPVVGALVSAFQSGLHPGDPPLFQVEAYTDSGGGATLPGLPSDIQAHVDITTSDPHGNQIEGAAGVVSGAWATFAGAKAGIHGKPDLVGGGPLTANTVVTLDAQDGADNALAALFIGGDAGPVAFKGGELYPIPLLLEPLLLFTDGLGEIHLDSLWPAGVPADTELWFQFAFSDHAASQDVSLSNAVQAITP
ncbi:MAG: hypothetical protein DRQ55_14540 [Planctomycetota bacterium]|nr:MAG: hypothetical protein DRQ55_14540 [Planctomycetota bacterium]